MSYSPLLYLCIFTQKTLMLFMLWKRVLKILRIRTLLSCLAMWIFSVLVRCLVQNKPNIWLCYRASCPAECCFHLDSPLPISLWPLAFLPLTPASCMPQSFFIGKKREMFEHPVFCLASQVMDLTIREYLHHPLPCVFPSPPSFTSIPPSASPLSSEMLLLPCLFFLAVAFVCESEWGACQSRDLSSTTLNQSGVLYFRTICLWWTWMSSLVCKLLSFSWMPIPLNWMHFYIAYIVISSSHLVWSCASSVDVPNR